MAAAAEEYAREARERALDVAAQPGTAARARPLLAVGIAIAATSAIALLLLPAGARWPARPRLATAESRRASLEAPGPAVG